MGKYEKMTRKKFEKVWCRSRTWWNTPILWCLRTEAHWIFDFSTDWTVSFAHEGGSDSPLVINSFFQVSTDDKYSECDSTSGTLWSFHLHGSFIIKGGCLTVDCNWLLYAWLDQKLTLNKSFLKTDQRGNQFFDRILLFFMPQKFQPDYIYLRHVKLLKGKPSTLTGPWSAKIKLYLSAFVYGDPIDMFWYSLCDQITENCFNSFSNHGCCHCWN